MVVAVVFVVVHVYLQHVIHDMVVVDETGGGRWVCCLGRMIEVLWFTQFTRTFLVSIVVRNDRAFFFAARILSRSLQ